MINARVFVLAAAGAIVSCSSVHAEDAFRIGLIDPLSGPAATTGEVGLKTWQFLAGEVNASGGLNGQKLEVVGYDNKINPQESLVQIQKALDAGIRIVTQGNGSSVAAAISANSPSAGPSIVPSTSIAVQRNRSTPRSLRDATAAVVRLLSTSMAELPNAIERLQAETKDQRRARHRCDGAI